jgi:hypothetical protein
MRVNECSSVTDFVVSDVAVHILNGRMSLVEFINASDGRRITLSACAEGVTFGGINTLFSLSNGSVKIGPNGMTVLWQPSK